MNFDKQNSMFKTNAGYDNWLSKYQFKNETPIETFIRVANDLASVETETLEQFKCFEKTVENCSVWNRFKSKFVNSWAYKFLMIMVNFDDDANPIGLKCTPGGRITANAGTDYKNATYLNCFINSPVKNAEINYKRSNFDGSISYNVNVKTPDDSDDLNNIFLTILEQAKTLASEGGYGINVSFIRPRGTIIKGTGILHPGVVSYLEVFDSVANCIVKGSDDGYVDKLKNYYKDEEFEKLKETLKKQTRKGAQICILNVNHPDIEEFVKAKQTHGRLTKFNMSVGVTSDFMVAVENDDMWDLSFKGKVSKTVRALELYNLIMESNYNRAEPGIIFLDNAKLNNPIEYVGSPDACNPCVAKGTLIAMKNGLKRVEDVKVGDEIKTINGFHKITSIEKHSNYPTKTVKFSDGFSKDVTSSHIYHSQNSEIENHKKWNTDTKLEDLKIGDYVRKSPYNINVNIDTSLSRDDGLLIGLYLGDGCYSNATNFNISCNSLEDNSYIINLLERYGISHRIDKSDGNCIRIYATYDVEHKIKKLFDKLKLNPNDKNDFDILSLINTNNDFIYGLIDGLYSSDGDVNLKARYPQIRFTNTNVVIHQLLKELLLIVGCDYKKYKKDYKDSFSVINGRKIYSKTNAFIGIIDNDSILNLHKNIQYISNPQKNNNFQHCISLYSLSGCKWKTKIVEIVDAGNCDVYDIYEECTDTWITEGYVNRGCGEIVCQSDLTTACLLGSVNLTQYVKIDCNQKGYFDYDKYCEDIGMFVRMLDNVCDKSNLPLQSYEYFVKNFRQIGIGLNGLGSMLLMLGIPYNSKKAVEMTEELVRLKESHAWKASALLAKEKGVFKYYDKDKFTSTEFFKSNRIPNDVKVLVYDYGVRNSKVSTQPPLGNCVKSTTKIHTNRGIKSMKELFVDNCIDIYKSQQRWYIPMNNDLKVLTHNNVYKPIKGYYVNGYDDVIRIKTDNDEIVATKEHKVLVQISEFEAEWVLLENVKLGDKILIKK